MGDAPPAALSRKGGNGPGHGDLLEIAVFDDPVAMPAKLLKAHAELDRAVDACYIVEPII